MAIFREDQLNGLAGFGAFAGNEDYCNKTYPRGISAQIDSWNTKCKKGGSLTNPGAYAAPWTVVGKNARGLPDDSILGTAMNVGKALAPGLLPGQQSPGLPSAPGGSMPSSGAEASMTSSATDFLTSPMGIALGGVAVVGLALMLKPRKKGKR